MSGEDAVRFFQALGDGTRLELLMRLRDGERTVGELVDALRCPQPKVSRHLKVLRDAGLVTDRRDGRHVTYALTTRRRWSPRVREWLDLLSAGFPPAPTPERAPVRPVAGTRPPAPRRPAATPTGTPPAGTASPPTEPPRVRRPRLETHLL